MDTKILKNIPKQPGIYQFFNDAGDIIYIWKSVNLKSRVSSYFNGKSKLNFAKKKMVDQIKEIKTIITNTDTESLILETTLIKKHKPKYNILMKDDKNHIYIKITSDQYPKIIKTRISPKGWISKHNKNYFGPYISTYYVWNILKILKKYFWYWIGDHHFFYTTQSYNLDKYLFDWDLKDASESAIQKLYSSKIEEMRKFLHWDFTEILEDLKTKMHLAAKALAFEKAAEIKKYIESIESLQANQIVRDGVKWDFDIINHIEKYEKNYIWLIEIRDSKITWYYNYELETKLWETKAELIQTFLENRLWESLESQEKKVIFIVPVNIEMENDFGISIEVPQIWNKQELLKLCYKNIYEYAHKKHIASLSTKSFTKKSMKELLSLLWLQEINRSIIFECNDISHLSWSHTVASRSVIENGKKETGKYKKFKIKNLEDGKVDDFDSMREIMERRLKEIEKTKTIPDLIVIDGWKWQLSSVVDVITSHQAKDEESKNLIERLQLIWLAKREEEVFLPWESDSIILDKWSEHLRLIQAIRDEAHRFAITFNRDSRSKSMKKNILESLPGIWPKTRKKILKEFWSLEWLQKADEEKRKTILNKSVLAILENHGLI